MVPSFFSSMALVAMTASGANWPAWRGPDGSGVTPEKNLPLRWSATENVRWKIPLPDRGNSTPIVWGDKIFLTQAIEADHLRSVVCFSRADGKQLWQKSVTYAEKEETHETNPYCSASPVTDGERVIVCHGSAGVFCYDFAGRELWKRDLGKQSFQWGNASSPVLHGDICILYFGPGKGSRLLGLNKKTGATIWQYNEPDIEVGKRTDGFQGKEPGIICTYSTPILVRADGRDELLMSFPRYLRAFNPTTGKELWSCDGLNPLIYGSPLHGDGVAVAMGGYFGNSIGVKTGGTGDVTGSRRLWHNVRTKAGIGSGVIHQGHIYMLNGSIAECIELQTGKTVWSERLKAAGPNTESWSSMVRAGDTLYILNQSGDTLVLKASPKFEQLGVNSLGNERSNSSIAVSDGELFIRTYKHLWCVGAAKLTAAK